ncbi:uncharacterized protein LOC125446623 [Stegostoma tigrinum]|uniref:uncharacterized protein LOC125446623 n=1 Tax=Stegostoma tigrinum TaxID=3053191 RepID=UPI00202B3E53|nr:uncharacterized protein LOC125446623 [Stegostoma tigrinum]
MQTIQMRMFLNLMIALSHTDSVLMKEVKVFQSPDVVHVTEGASVQLNCTFETLGPVGQIVWKRAFENAEVSVRNPFYERRLETLGSELFAQGKASIKINRVSKIDSDYYYCQVEFMTIGKSHGTTTQLVVTDQYGTDCPDPPISQSFLLMLAPLALFTLVIIVLFFRLYSQHKVLESLKGSHTVTHVKGNDRRDEAIEVQETSSGPRQETVLPFKSQTSLPVYSTVKVLSTVRETTSSNQHLTYAQVTFH